MTKVNDMLRETQENAFRNSTADLNKMFNMQIDEIDDNKYSLNNDLDPVSEEYFTKLSKLRNE